MREETEFRPKPMVEVGGEPLLWHIMRHFAQFGHDDFVICAGYKKELIEAYFDPASWLSRAQRLEQERPNRGAAESSWKIQVVDTGDLTPTGGRLKLVAGLLNKDEPFFCTYGDGIAPVDLDKLVLAHKSGSATGTITTSHPSSRFGVVRVNSSGFVTGFEEKPIMKELVSIGFFVFEMKILDGLNSESVLESDLLPRLANSGELKHYFHDGFWQPIDTYRELLMMQELWSNKAGPWDHSASPKRDSTASQSNWA